MIFQSDTGDELVDDFVSVITSMAARIYGRRRPQTARGEDQAVY
ncbi:MAG TPA: hypothetical protein VNE61_06155 [Ktedonobacteraceae bacterium]|nr:hypothetical protein [Ktedonobacteraceae bacterium]